MNKKVAFHTLGCKLNSSETDMLAASFTERGYDIVNFDEKSDVYLINTCTVTHQADAQCRQIIRRARKTSPEAVIAVTGCYAQADPTGVSKIPGVDLVFGTREKYNIFDHLDNNSCFDEPLIRNSLDINPFEREEVVTYATSRTRAFLKIQDGCSYKCTYCIIPSVRGESVCRDRQSVFARVREIRDAGFQEIVLTAVNLGEYEDGEDYVLLHLLKDIDKIPGVPRIRLTSIEPNCLSEELIRYIADSEKICNHFHVPLQSGSDTVLKNMRRKYMSGHYADVMEMINKLMPDAGIGADVMVGFPGETDKRFTESMNFIEEMPIDYLHVFRFSPRTGTYASEMENFVHPDKAKERSGTLINISNAKKENFLREQIGRRSNVLFESNQKTEGIYEGFTENYARVKSAGSDIHNTIRQVAITGHDGGKILTGELLN